MENMPSTPKNFHVFDKDLDIDTASQFEKASKLAVDTEAMGLLHGRDRLCLVQICDPQDNVACIKIGVGQESAPRLKRLFENKDIEKVFHFARFDIAALSNALQINVNPIFCTKVASKIARTYSPRHGLKDVVLELTGVELNKKQQSSDWGRVDELSKEQLNYAANDTRYLLKVRDQLESMLRRENRLDIANKCFSVIPIMAELDIQRFINIFEH